MGMIVAIVATINVVWPGHLDQNNPQTWCQRWLPVVRFRLTRKKGHAQRRATKLET
jgi:hypothetical protein